MAETIPVVKEVESSELRGMLDTFDAVRNVPFMGPNGAVSQDSDGHLYFSNTQERYRMTVDSYDRLGQVLGIPVPYVQKTPPYLVIPHMNYWLQANSDETYSLGMGPDDVVRYFYKGDRVPVSSVKIMDMLEDELGSDLGYHHVSVHPDYVRFNVVTAASQREVAVGDPVRYGISVTNSPSFKSNLELSSYVHRLVCTNGMVSQENQIRYQSKPDDDQDDWLESTINEIIAQVEGEHEKLELMNEVNLTGHFSDYLTEAYRMFRIPKAMQEPIEHRVMDTQPQTLYDMFNIVTDLASNSPEALESARLSNRLMITAGLMASHRDLCEACGRVS